MISAALTPSAKIIIACQNLKRQQPKITGENTYMLFKYLPMFIGREFGEIDEYIFKRYGYAGDRGRRAASSYCVVKLDNFDVGDVQVETVIFAWKHLQ
jgi:hypothetical protein